MTILAWLLILALLLVLGLMVLAAFAGGSKVPVWLRASIIAAVVFFLASGVLLLREGRGGGGSPAMEIAQAQVAPTVAPDPYAEIGPPIPAEGRKFYLEAGCHRCHTIGAGSLVGPDLIDAAVRYDREFLVRWILDPESIYRELDVEVVNPGYPAMPAIELEPQEALLIARYLESFPEKP